MKKNMRFGLAALLAFSLIGVGVLWGCSGNNQKSEAPAKQEAPQEAKQETVELQVFAANSLSKAMDAVQQLYMKDHSGVTFADTQYLSSGELNELLKGGAYADLLISASKSKMDDAVEAGYVDAATRFDMFNNDLVMVVSENSSVGELTLADIATGAYTVAVGDDSVPAGNYANQALSTVGCFVDPDGKTGSESAGKANGTDAYANTPLAGKVNTQTSVGNVCKQVESGAVDVAFVYSSDVHRFGGVKVAGVVPADTHKKIVYPAAICLNSKNTAAVQDFLDWATTDEEAIKTWQEWGFELVAS